MVTATLLWGGTFVVIRDSVARVDPVALVATRFLAAGLVLMLLALARRRLGAQAWRGGVLAGALFAMGYAFQAIGLERTSAGSSAFLTSTGGLLAAWFAWPLLGQRPGVALTLGIAVAFVGTILLGGAGAAFRLGPGERWTLLGAAAFALQVVVIARFAPKADPLALVAVQAVTVALVLLPFAAGRLATLLTLDGADRARLLYLIVAGTLIAPWLQVVAQTALPAGRIGLLFTLEPVFALVFALTLGGERFPARWWWGASLVLLAVTGVEASAARRASASPPASP